MKPHYVKLVSGRSSFIVFERSAQSFPFHWHYHPEFELTLITESRGQRLVGDSMEDYGPGDLVLLGANLPHTWRSRSTGQISGKHHRAIVVQFREDFLGSDFFSLPEMASIRGLLHRAQMGLAFGHTRTAQAVAPILSNLPRQAAARKVTHLLDILYQLSVERVATSLSSTILRPTCRLEERRRVDNVCLYLVENASLPLDYKRLAGEVHMEQSSLCRFFKRATGRTITSYLNEIRVSEAAHLLTATDQSILDVGLTVGFENHSNFVRQFRGIRGLSPRELRAQFSRS